MEQAPDRPESWGSAAVRERLPQYMESMWSSITTTSQAVTGAVQEHIVSRIPMLGMHRCIVFACQINGAVWLVNQKTLLC